MQAPQSQNNLASLKPPLKWAGGKRWLIPHLIPVWERQRQRRYVEPFCGGLAMALGLKPEHALLNDINQHLINFYTQLQKGLKLTVETENCEASFYAQRDRFNLLIRQGKSGSVEAAQLFYYLNRTGYNGLCRFNRSGEFNVPFGKYAKINYTRNFQEYKLSLGRWLFSCNDVEAVEIEPDDFVYADPPYDVEFTSYSSGGFSWDDQVRTAEWLAKHSGPVFLSNQATPRIVRLYKQLGFRLQYLDAPRRISCTGDRTAAPEVLAMRGI